MAVLKPFCAYRPKTELSDKIAALPYDVYNREEAKEIVKNNPFSFLAIDRPETAFDDSIDMYSTPVYEKARELLYNRIQEGWFIKEAKPCFYLYELTFMGRSQNGIVGCASIDDYLNNVIKKHENTRADKELDRINHVDICDMQTGPIFLAYKKNEALKELIKEKKKESPVYSFTSNDVSHKVYVISDNGSIEKIQSIFEETDSLYIADGHHRCASAVKVGLKRRKENASYDRDAEFNYFLSVLFSSDELRIMPYNRVVRDLNGLNEKEFLKKVEKDFEVTDSIDNKPVSPKEKAEFGMLLNNRWYKLKAKSSLLSDDPIKGLDVSILQDYLLNPILGITDPKSDKRIDFVGGIRGLNELEKRCNKDMVLAFSMYPTSIDELFCVADNNGLMPPKSTWFEPKLLSGLFLHSLKQ